MQREHVIPTERGIRYNGGRMIDAVTGKFILWCPVCKRWFVSERRNTVTCGDKCRKALSRERGNARD